MRKKINIILLALFAVTAIYSLIAASMTRGLGVYQLGTTAGLVLASSWQYTAAVAVVLLAVVVIPWGITLLKNRKLKQAEVAANPAAPAPAAAAAAEALKNKVSAWTSNVAKAVQNAPSIPGVEPQQNAAPVAAQQPVSAPAAEQPAAPVEAADQAQPTEILSPAAPAEPAQPQESAYCPMCGAAVKPGLKFCTACGAQIGGSV